MSRVAVGDRYGRLVVLELIPHRKNPRARCLCDCGKESFPLRGRLKNGHSKSCGCLGFENRTKGTHRMSKTATYRCWQNMKRRCLDKTCSHYHNYGGRGITVSDAWMSFEQFFADMGEQPKGWTLDRIDNDKGYSKENCRWASRKEQATNKRTAFRWVIDGVEYESAKEAAKALGITVSAVQLRCRGYKGHGKYYPPKPGWLARPAYESKSGERHV